jgi:hypothetical protein
MIMWEPFSPTITCNGECELCRNAMPQQRTAGACVLPLLSAGIMEASTTRSRSTPRTRRRSSTTAAASAVCQEQRLKAASNTKIIVACC